MFGSTGLKSLTEPFRVFDFTTIPTNISIFIWKYLTDSDDSDRGVFGWCVWSFADGKTNPTDASGMDICVEPNYSDAGTLYYPTNMNVHFNARLVGFRALIGYSRSGLV